MSSESKRKRILLLAATTGYQTRMFQEAGERAGFEIVMATDRCHVLDDPWGDHAIAVRFEEPEKAAESIARAVGAIEGIVAVGDKPTLIAALAAERLGIRYNSPDSVNAARNKHLARERFRAAGLPVPEFQQFPLSASIDQARERVSFPCVAKPLGLSMSRGVIRANDEQELTSALERIRAILNSPDIVRLHDESDRYFQIEEYIPGREFALEGLVIGGVLRTFTVFDKPDPLEGPFFEETIYVSPARMSPDERGAAESIVQGAVGALGLTDGPVHAEFRVNKRGIWMLEVAARPIGGLCATAVAFDGGTGLEEVIIRHAAGENISHFKLDPASSGVMMIPIPANGIFVSAEGIEDAREMPLITGVAITAKQGQRLLKLPEGNSYLGFIFARGGQPDSVEQALRDAHARLQFTIAAELPVAKRSD